MVVMFSKSVFTGIIITVSTVKFVPTIWITILTLETETFKEWATAVIYASLRSVLNVVMFILGNVTFNVNCWTVESTGVGVDVVRAGVLVVKESIDGMSMTEGLGIGSIVIPEDVTSS
jgi:hypothetical protein